MRRHARAYGALAAALALMTSASGARAQGVGPTVVLPTTRPRTSLQMVGSMQVPWSVNIHPATNYVAIGQCLPVYIDLLDASGKDIPRNSLGQRVTIADFDWTATGNAAVGKYDGPNAWAVCACPAAAVGSTIHVMATYPAASLADKSKVAGLAFQSYIELPITPAKGTNSPAGCENALVTTTVAISVPGGGAPPTVAGPSGRPLQSVAPGAPATNAPPANPAGQTVYTGTPLPLAPATLAPAQPPASSPPAASPAQPAGASPPSGTAYPPATSAAPPAAASNNYRVVATGFRVLHQTKDDILSRDGHGDEVYGGFLTFHYDRATSQLLDKNMRRTQVVGENHFDGLQPQNRFATAINSGANFLLGGDPVQRNGRIQGGTATQYGGLAQNDVFPPVADPSKSYGATPSTSTFPFLVWEGPLTNAHDAIVILPTLWEFDGFPDGFNKWQQYEQASVSQIWSDPGVQAAVSGTQLALITPPGTLETSFGTHFGGSNAFSLVYSIALGPVAALIAGSYDRPIGVGMNGVGGTGGLTNGPVLPRRAIVITREIAEASLTKLASYNPATVAPGVFTVFGAPPVVLPAAPPGTIAVQLFESPADDLQGQYILYLHVERMP